MAIYKWRKPVVDLMWKQKLESWFRSQADKKRNADTPDQIRPKEKVKRKPLKGFARKLYLDGNVKLSKAEVMASKNFDNSKKKEFVKDVD